MLEFLRAILCLIVIAPFTHGDEPKSVDRALPSFREAYKADAWVASGGRRSPFMQPLGDGSWKVRMRSLQAVVARGRESVPALAEWLKSGKIHFEKRGTSFADHPTPEQIVAELKQLTV